MKVFQHTRNERNLFFNPDPPDRSKGDSLLIAEPKQETDQSTFNTHFLTHLGK